MQYRCAHLELDTERHTLTRDGEVVAVEPQVFDLLVLLLENAGHLVTRDQIVDRVWQGRIVSESAISARIAAARKAVGDDGKSQSVIRTIARRGLMWVAEQAAAAPPQPQSEPPPPATKPSVQRIRYARDKDGHRLAYALTGQGPDVLCFNPPMTNDLEAEWQSPAMRAMLEAISDHFRYLRYDNLATGQSERAPPRIDFAEQAEEARTVADAAGFDRFCCISYSGGVLPAIHFATLYPERVSKLVIVGGYVDGRSRRGRPDAPAPDDPLKFMISAGWSERDNAFATAFMTSYLPEGPLDVVREVVGMMQTASPSDVMLSIRDAINQASVAHLLDKVQCPTLVIQGRHDAVHPLSEAQKLASGIPNAELAILETANHMPVHGHKTWQPFMETLVDFLLTSD